MPSLDGVSMLEAVGLEGEDEELEIYEQPPPGPSLGERHAVDDKAISNLTSEQKQEAARCLRLTTMFKFCSDESITRVVDHMRREEFSEGEVGLHDSNICTGCNLMFFLNRSFFLSCSTYTQRQLLYRRTDWSLGFRFPRDTMTFLGSWLCLPSI